MYFMHKSSCCSELYISGVRTRESNYNPSILVFGAIRSDIAAVLTAQSDATLYVYILSIYARYTHIS